MLNTFNNIPMRPKLFGVFVSAAIIVALVGGVAYYNLTVAKAAFTDIAGNRIPSIVALQTIHEAQTDVRAAQNDLRNPSLDAQEHAASHADINAALKRADDAWKIYAPLPQTTAEAALWREFAPLWEQWKTDVHDLVALQRQREDLLANGISASHPLVINLDAQSRSVNLDSDASFAAAESKLVELVSINKQIADSAAKDSMAATAQARAIMLAVIFITLPGAALLCASLVRQVAGNTSRETPPPAPDANDIKLLLGSVAKLEESTRTLQTRHQEMQDKIAKLVFSALEEENRLLAEAEKERQRQVKYKMN